VLKRGEIATGVAVPLPGKKHAACFVKLRRYEGEDLAQASVTVLALPGTTTASRLARSHRARCGRDG